MPPAAEISRRLLLAALGWLAAGIVRAAPPGGPGTGAPVRPDPSLESETLGNGLEVVLLPRRLEPGQVSLRLIVRAGSLDEREDERGLAHLIEHLAFDGTAHYPPGRLVPYLQRLGLAPGADLNASTGFSRTVFRLDLPSERDLPEALRVLRDFADGIEFAPAGLARQRAVVLSEIQSRSSAAELFEESRLGALYAGGPIARRMPMGEPKLVAAATPERLRALYRRSYAPGRMILLAVGDFSPETAESLVERRFNSLAAAPSALPPPAPAAPPPGLGFAAIPCPFLPDAEAEFDTVRPPGDGSWRALEGEAAEGVTMAALDRRLVDAARADPRISHAAALLGAGPDGLFREVRLQAQAPAAQWPLALFLLEQEIRRARTEGFRPGEIREAVQFYLAARRAERGRLASLPDSALADALASTLALGRTWPDPDAVLEVLTKYLADFTAADADRALAGILSEGERRVLLFAPPMAALDSAQVRAAWEASGRRPLPSPSPAGADALPPLEARPVPPGRIVRRWQDAAVHLEMDAFANGVLLNFRSDRNEAGRFSLCARVGGDRENVPEDRPGLDTLAAAVLAWSGAGADSRPDIDRLVSLHGVDFGLRLEEGQLTLNASGPASELRFVLQLLADLLADPRPGTGTFERALATYGQLRQRATGSAPAWAASESLFQLRGADPRFFLPQVSRVAAYPRGEVLAWMDANWFEGPLEIGLIGDLDPAQVAAAAGPTVGSLPRRGPGSARRPPGPARPVREVRREPLSDGVAALRLAWPAGDLGDPSRRDALRFAVDALVDRLRLEFRDRLGATYAPSGRLLWDPRRPAEGFVSVDLTFDPAAAPARAAQALAVAASLARDGLRRPEYDRLRPGFLQGNAETARSAAWWLREVLDQAQSEPEVLEEARRRSGAAAPGLAEVDRAAAATFVPAAPVSVLVIPQPTAPPK